MSLARPGSLLWLLGHELRLTLRGAGRSAGRGGPRLLIVLLVVLGLLGAFVGLPLGLAAQRLPRTPSPPLALALDLGALAVFLLMLSQALAGAVDALYVRGDLDLLLSSPLDGRKVLAAKGVAIAVRPLMVYGALLLVAVGPAAVLGRPQWLGALALLVAMAMLAAALAIGLAMALFASIGPRATRASGQVLAALIGGTIFLASQARRYVGDGGVGMVHAATAWATPERFAPSSPLAWPASAMSGAPLPVAGALLLSAAVFAATLAGLGRRFVRNAALSAGVQAGTPTAAGRRGGRARFAGGALRAVVVKELRLLVRDPSLLSQVGVRMIYLLPLCYALVQGARFGGHAMLASGVALVSVVAAQVAGSLAWITVSAEDAPDLLASSPLAGERARMGKLLAALLPLAVIMAAPLAILAVLAPWAGVVATVGVALSCASSALLNLWFERPASRGDFRRRGGSLVTSLAEIALGIAWGFACALAVVGTAWALVPVAISLGLTTLFWALRRPDRAY